MEALNELRKQFEAFRNQVGQRFAALARLLSSIIDQIREVDTAVSDLKFQLLELRTEVQQLRRQRDEKRPRPKLKLNSDELQTRSELQDVLIEFFNEEDLKNLAFDMGIDYESLPADGKQGKARELIVQTQRDGRLWMLLAECEKARPNVDWSWYQYM